MSTNDTVLGQIQPGSVARVESCSIASVVDRRAKLLASEECQRNPLTSVLTRQWCPFCKGSMSVGDVDHQAWCPTGMVAQLEITLRSVLEGRERQLRRLKRVEDSFWRYVERHWDDVLTAKALGYKDGLTIKADVRRCIEQGLAVGVAACELAGSPLDRKWVFLKRPVIRDAIAALQQLRSEAP